MIGAAPCPLEVLEFFAAIGIPICEVWGMSETTSIATLVPQDDAPAGDGRPADPRGGDPAGRGRRDPRPRRDDHGRATATSPRRRPRRSTPTAGFTPGTSATFDEAGFLKIVDRKKELIINAAGKNMSPANIEQQLKQGSPLIGQAIAIGDGRPYNVALIVLDPDASAAFAAPARPERRLA